ncbi:MAG: pyridoxal phosphate-dependent aminotransferase [Clostridiaceae bacterium]|nr:pyridoxal phosphate-dependent aminotransferase [Clostridiaceae bacterium]
MFLSKRMLGYGQESSVIREIFEYGLKRKQQIGDENVFDFSIGNPNIPTHKQVTEKIKELVNTIPPEKLHGYTSGPGAPTTKKAIANYLNKTFSCDAKSDLIYITSGAAAALAITFKAFLNEDDEVITFAPFFPDYKVFVESTNAKLIALKTQPENFLPDFDLLEKAINPKTKIVLINSPNNPTGVIYSEKTIQKLAELLKKKENEYGHPIFLVSDEPYREISYGKDVPFVTHYYKNSIVIYSFSKSLSLAGERIGYILVSTKAKNADMVYKTICGAGRALGYVCASSMFQRVIEDCIGLTSDFSIYEKNRNLLYEHLIKIGFNCVYPDGAFYLFMESPIADAEEFCEKARDFELYFVPSNSFGHPGFVRIGYCVSTDQIEKSLDSFTKLANYYQLSEIT